MCRNITILRGLQPAAPMPRRKKLRKRPEKASSVDRPIFPACRPRPPQPDAIFELTLGEHDCDLVALVLETGHDDVLKRVDTSRRPRDLSGQPAQAEL